MTGDQLRADMRSWGIRQAAVARACGVSESTVSRQLSGHARLTPPVVLAAEHLVAERRRAGHRLVLRELLQAVE